MLDIFNQLENLKQQGISFNIVSEAEAVKYLALNNYYYKIESYCKNYDKYKGGKNNGKYIALDFAYLKDLAIIDMKLRYILLQCTLNIEHYVKLELTNYAIKQGEDGYAMCSDFQNSLDDKQFKRLRDELSRNTKSIYLSCIKDKYNENYPIWAFLEIISFGWLIAFYKFCSLRFADKDMENKHYLLKSCKDIRNAAAHSSCILNNLRANTATISTRTMVSQALANINNISKNTRRVKMSNARIQQIVTLLYAHKIYVTSNDIQGATSKSLLSLSKRIKRNINYYDSNQLIQTSLIFLTKVIDNWYK